MEGFQGLKKFRGNFLVEGGLGEAKKEKREKHPRVAQAFSIRVAQVFEFCFIVAGAMHVLSAAAPPRAQ